MSGTDLANGAATLGAAQCNMAHRDPRYPIDLCACYAMSGTGMYGDTLAMRCPVLTQAMLLLSAYTLVIPSPVLEYGLRDVRESVRCSKTRARAMRSPVLRSRMVLPGVAVFLFIIYLYLLRTPAYVQTIRPPPQMKYKKPYF
eukprot:3298176-Rhodomonas_salina.1